MGSWPPNRARQAASSDMSPVSSQRSSRRNVRSRASAMSGGVGVLCIAPRPGGRGKSASELLTARYAAIGSAVAPSAFPMPGLAGGTPLRRRPVIRPVPVSFGKEEGAGPPVCKRADASSGRLGKLGSLCRVSSCDNTFASCDDTSGPIVVPAWSPPRILIVAGNFTQPGCCAIHSVGSGAPRGTNTDGTRNPFGVLWELSANP